MPNYNYKASQGYTDDDVMVAVNIIKLNWNLWSRWVHICYTI